MLQRIERDAVDTGKGRRIALPTHRPERIALMVEAAGPRQSDLKPFFSGEPFAPGCAGCGIRLQIRDRVGKGIAERTEHERHAHQRYLIVERGQCLDAATRRVPVHVAAQAAYQQRSHLRERIPHDAAALRMHMRRQQRDEPAALQQVAHALLAPHQQSSCRRAARPATAALASPDGCRQVPSNLASALRERASPARSRHAPDAATPDSNASPGRRARVRRRPARNERRRPSVALP